MKKLLIVFLFVSIGALFTLCTHDSTATADLPTVCFQNEVLPIFQNNCTMSGCHGSDGRNLKLTNYSEIMREVTPGKPKQSNLYTAITNAWSPMPPSPHKPLSQNQRTTVFVWILQGANETTCSK